jgi:peptidase E
MTAPTIFAMGGGGFTMEPGNPALDEFVLSLSPRPVPRLLFLPTASGDAEAQVAQFHAAFDHMACEPSHLSLFRLGATGSIPLRDFILSMDIVYAGGGSMRNLLAIWHAHDLDRILVEAWERGTVLAGLSAGAMCWFTGGISCSTGAPAAAPGLGLLPGSLSVHRDGEASRLPVFREAVRSGALPPGWAADDGVGLVFKADRFVRAVSSRPTAGASYVTPGGEEELEVQWLGDRSHAEATRPPTPVDIREYRELRRRGGGRY